MVFKNLCALVLRKKIASELEGLRCVKFIPQHGKHVLLSNVFYPGKYVVVPHSCVIPTWGHGSFDEIIMRCDI